TMSKLVGFTVVLVLAALGVAIASLVFNILIFNQINVSDPAVDPVDPNVDPAGCPTLDKVSDEAGWKEAANRLLDTVDLSVDPCEDFYQFTCGKYLQDTDLQGQSRKGTYDEAQYEINLALANYFDDKDTKLKGETEKYEKTFYDSCVADALNGDSEEVTKQKWADLTKDLNTHLGFPLMGVKKVPQSRAEIFTTMGKMERLYTGGPFITSFVTADFADNNTNALYLNQPALHFARDYFVKPQFISKLQDYADNITDLILAYQKNTDVNKMDHQFCPVFNGAAEKSELECAQMVAQWAVNMERSIAMASWPDTELRNYKQQYNPFDALSGVDFFFQQLYLGNYVRGLMDMGPDEEISGFNVVLSQPTYFSALDGQFDANHISEDDYVDYLALHFLMDNAGEYGIKIPSVVNPAKNKNRNGKRRDTEPKFHRYVTRRGYGARRISRKPLNSKGIAVNENDAIRTDCIDTLIDYMPFGPGYTYVKNRDDREDVKADVKIMTENIITQFSEMLNSLDWIDPDSLTRAHAKSTSLQKNYLWPEFFGDFKSTKDVDAHNARYKFPANFDKNYWTALKNAKFALQTTEQFDIVKAGGDRSNFLQSPATVNAWYQPERNSITFPFGILNPPYYDLSYPQAYSYAGQGGTAGHELTHGYDDEGTQFDEVGRLAECEFTHCSILDDKSRSGFVDMAQCVVQQYNSGCCPLKKGNVRCTNGDTTQGENIADIGGQQAAYRAYNQYMADQRKTELRLPGLEQYTPQQIFWMTYGVSWCMKITDDRLVRQLMTDPHAPSSCRVNQVMQDIPQFGQDFKCKRGVSPMYPNDADRCKVWVGY
ncbi:hypothetical protein PFISCL1PPCAC_23832, partial [Pristionchus fissidentatus]